MPDDTVVAEVRNQRAQLLEAAGGTLDKLVEFLRRKQTEAGRTVVTLPARSTDAPSRAS